MVGESNCARLFRTASTCGGGETLRALDPCDVTCVEGLVILGEYSVIQPEPPGNLGKSRYP